MTQKLFGKDCLIVVHDKTTGTGVLLDINRFKTVGMVESEIAIAREYLVKTFKSKKENITSHITDYVNQRSQHEPRSQRIH